MRIARTLLLAALAAVTALALTATAANANHLGLGGDGEDPGETLMVQDEGTGVPCTTVTKTNHTIDGGCEISAHGGEIRLQGHLFGIEDTASTCEVDFAGHVDANGEGWVDAAVTGAPEIGGEPCTRDACEVEEGVMEPWPAHGDEDPVHGAYMQVEFCVIDTTVSDPEQQRCLIHVPINEVSLHHYSSGAFTTTRSGEFPAAVEHANATNCEIEVPREEHPIEVASGQIELVH